MSVYLIDGYNVLFSDPAYRGVADGDMDAGRARLVDDIVSFVAPGDRAVIVFDGASNPASDGAEHDAAGATVIFSAFGRDADSVIEQIAAESVAAGDDVVVVTSDAQTQWVALGQGALRLSSAGFVRQIQESAKDDGEYSLGGSTHHALDRRIDPEIRTALQRWARGD